eukprot:Gregarina_sp_Poly_1__6448@NODE_3448_length_1092_cov_269_291707_g2184_i0_p1_GENE_NODE_3448_length_1092_cov_269_291707_g2184_i0NODE_3448_length_1092_cov_269_291707_g2184_i0_p1_ORF_typecomplete_len292_score61_60SIMPL/PF04402_14/5_3e29Kinaselike/PF14531_6/0_056_NODE_3448_length_1092_cov_269_291707_g2184_i064939
MNRPLMKLIFLLVANAAALMSKVSSHQVLLEAFGQNASDDVPGCHHSQHNICVAKPREISVTGKGQVVGRPDVAVLHWDGRANNEDAVRAKESLDASIIEILNNLHQLGLAEEDISHMDLRVEKKYSWKDGEQRFLGYCASQPLEVSVHLNDSAKNALLESVVDSILNVDAADFELTHIELKIKNPEELRSAARKLAVRDAVKAAKEVAAALDMELGDASKVTVQRQKGFEIMQRDVAFATTMKEAGGSVAPVGDRKITIEEVVDVTFDLLSQNPPKMCGGGCEANVVYTR